MLRRGAIGTKIVSGLLAGVCVSLVSATVLSIPRQERSRMSLFVRQALFTTRSIDQSIFFASPEESQELGFLVDPPVEVTALKEFFPSLDVRAMKGIGAQPDPLRRAWAIGRFLGDRQGTCSGPRLRDQLAWVQQEGGCCSDRTEVVLALAPAVGVEARELTNFWHTFLEVWIEDEERWVFFDPFFMVMAEMPRGHFLSTQELRYRLVRQEVVHWVSVARDYPIELTEKEIERFIDAYTGQTADPRWLELNMGSNVRQQARLEGDLPFLPGPVRQLVSFSLGVRPGYVIMADSLGAASAQALTRTRRILLLDLLVGVLFTGAVGVLVVRRGFRKSWPASDGAGF